MSLRNLFGLAALLPLVSVAAEPGLMDFVMPGARVLAYINVRQIANSPIGQAIKREAKARIAESKPEWRQQIEAVSAIDITEFVQEVVIAATVGPGKEPPVLIIVRGSLDPATIAALAGKSGRLGEFEGVPLLISEGKNEGAAAFFGGKIAVLGKPALVKAAIQRFGHAASLPAALATKVGQYQGRYDAWVAAAGPFPATPGGKTDFMGQIEAFEAALRLSPDFELNALVTANSEKDAAGMNATLGWITGAMQAQQNRTGQKQAGLENFHFALEGRRLRLSVKASEQQVRTALLRGMQAGMAAARPAAGGVGSPPFTVQQSTPAAGRPAVSNGMPPVAPGTIRIQSSPSDMGTVTLPAGKDQ